MDNRLHNVSRTSNVKRAHKRKVGTRLCDKRLYENGLGGYVAVILIAPLKTINLVLDGYTFIKENHPLNVKRGGVGLYIKDSFPATNRPDMLTLSECIVCEIQLNRKNYFFATIYRSPSQSATELVDFMENFELTKMAAENPYCVIITGDFNARCPQWWENDLENDAGKSLEPFIADLGLQQLISEPTHFMGDSRSCIDLISRISPIFLSILEFILRFMNNAIIKSFGVS